MEWLWLALFISFVILTWLPIGAITVRALRVFDPAESVNGYPLRLQEKEHRDEVFFWLGYISLFMYIVGVVWAVLWKLTVLMVHLIQIYWHFVCKLRGR